jgi:hypothetical protein
MLLGSATICDGANERAQAVWTDPAKAATDDPDFTIQGEYGIDAKGQPWGVQVVALGGGAFDAYALEGGLPGLGWTRDSGRIRLSGTRSGRRVALASEDGEMTVTIGDGKATLRRSGQVLAALPRVERKSPTVGVKPRTAAAIILFDGKTADAWTGGRVAGGLLAANNSRTKQTFTDYRLHVEFRTPYMPYARGQQRGNSGVYHQGRYETQVLDSFGLEGRMNETGGIYSIAAPRINICFPPLAWQTYDVDFTAAKFDQAGQLQKPAEITVRLNGVLVQRDQPLPHTTTAAPIKTITPAPGPIFIQYHNNPVYYRNIWIVPKTSRASATPRGLFPDSASANGQQGQPAANAGRSAPIPFK